MGFDKLSIFYIISPIRIFHVLQTKLGNIQMKQKNIQVKLSKLLSLIATLITLSSCGGGSGGGGGGDSSLNQAPEALDRSFSVEEDNTLGIMLIATAADATIASYQIVTQPGNGTLTGTGASRVYSPNSNFNGSDFIEFTATDSEGAVSRVARYDITVTPANDAPGFSSSSSVFFAENSTSAVVTLTATDVDNDAITFSITGGSDSNSFTLNNTVISFNSAPDFENPTDSDADNNYSVIVSATDGMGSSTQTITVTVTDVADLIFINQPPEALDRSFSVEEDNTLSIMLIATDTVATIASYQIVTQPGNGTLTGTGTSHVYSPNSNFNGSDFIEFTATDNNGAVSRVARYDITVTAVNDAPGFSSSSSVFFAENSTSAVVTLTATDVENDTITFSITGGSDSNSFTLNNAVLAFNSAPDFENPTDSGADNDYSVIVSATDSMDSSTLAITVTVTDAANQAPEALDRSFSVEEDNTLNIMLIATDTDTTIANYQIVTQPGNGTLTGTGASRVYSPNSNFNGSDFIEFTATDSEEAVSRVARYDITVTADNDAPEFSSSSSVFFAENSTSAVVTLTATDVDNDTITFSITGGSDSNSFTLNNAVLAFNSAPDFENPTDSGADNDYSVTVSATDGMDSSTLAITVTVTDAANQPPEALDSSFSVEEDNTLNIMLIAIAPDATIASYQIVTPPGNGTLTGTGASRVYSPNSNFNGSDFIEFTATDSEGAVSRVARYDITVTAVNDAPGFSSSSSVFFVENSTSAVVTLTATDVENDTITFSITGGSDSNSFTLNNAVLAFNSAPDFENPTDSDADNDYSVIVSATDSMDSSTLAITVTVTDAANQPPIALDSSFSVEEDNTLNIMLIAIAADTTIASYQIVTQPGNGTLTGTGASRLYSPNSNFNGSDFIEFTATDSEGAVSRVARYDITVTAVNDAPGFSSSSSVFFAENSTSAVVTLTATDVENDTITFSITGGSDSNSFTLNNAVLAFNSAPDFENPTDSDADNNYSVIVSATDSMDSSTLAITVTVTDAANQPPEALDSSFSVEEDNTLNIMLIATDTDTTIASYQIVTQPGNGTLTGTGASRVYSPNSNFNGSDFIEFTATDSEGAVSRVARYDITVTAVNDAPGFSSSSSVFFAENSTSAVVTLTATDVENDTITFSITGGSDSNSFTLNNAVLAFNSAPDFENPTDSDADNNYSVIVSATDSMDSSTLAITVTVTDAANQPPEALDSSFSVEEDNTLNIMLIATDTDTTIASYQIVTQPGNGTLTGTGASRVYSPNSNFNGSDFIEFTATDSEGAVSRVARYDITVTAVNDAPGFSSSSSVFFVENSTSAVVTLTATDVENDTFTFSITGGSDSNSFTLNNAVLAFNSAPDFENPTDSGADNDYSVTVSATDGMDSSTLAITVTVTDAANQPPEALDRSFSVEEDNTLNIMLIAIAPDATIASYQIVTPPGNGTLTGTGASRVYSPNSNFNGSDFIEFTATDSEEAVSRVARYDITVTAVNDAPGFSSSSTVFFVENSTSAVVTLTATDVENDTITFSITGGSDSNSFTLNNAVLAFNSAPDFENPTDSDTDNDYSVTVSATDGMDSSTLAITVTVTDAANQAPEALDRSFSVEEDNTLNIMLIATDTDTTIASYQIVTQPVNGTLTGTGASRLYSPNSNFNGSDFIEFTATDSEEAVSRVARYDITVTAVNDAPGFSSSSTVFFAENSTSAVVTLTATDVENDAITFSITGGSDSNSFTLNNAVLAFNSAPDFENPTDSDTDNDYSVTVSATDGMDSSTLAITVTVTDESQLRLTVSYPPPNSNLGGGATQTTVTGNLFDDEDDDVSTTDIDSVMVNSIAAQLGDGNSRWLTRVPVSAGFNTLTIDVSDGLTTESVIQLLNNAPILGTVNDMVLDSTNNRLLIVDGSLNIIAALNLTTGNHSVSSASGTGSGIDFGTLLGLVLDSNNNRILVTDSELNAIIAVDLVTGNRSLISAFGTGSGISFAFPSNLVLDSNNNRVLVTDANLFAIIAVDLTTGDRSIISSLVTGSGTDFAFPNDLVLDSNNNRILVTDSFLNAIIEVDLTTGNRTVISDNATGSGVNFLFSSGIVLDSNNNRVLVIDSFLNAIIAVDLATGNRTVISDNSTGSGFNFSLLLDSIVLDSNNNRVLVANTNPNAIVAVDLTTGDRTVMLLINSDVVSGINFSFPTAAVLDNNNNRLLVADAAPNNAAIVEEDLATGNRNLISDLNTGSGTNLNFPSGLALDSGNNRVLVTDSGSAALIAVDLSTGNRTVISDSSTGSGIDFVVPQDLVLDSDNNRVLVSDGSTAVIAVDLATGNRTVISDSSTGSGIDFGFLHGLVLDSDNNRILVSDEGIISIVAVDLATGDRTVISGSSTGSGTNFISPFSIVLDGNNNRVLVTDIILNAIVAVDLATGNRTVISGENTSFGFNFSFPTDLVLDSNNNRLLVIDADLNNIITVDLATGERAIDFR